MKFWTPTWKCQLEISNWSVIGLPDNDLKHISELHQKFIQDEKTMILFWSLRSHDLNVIDIIIKNGKIILMNRVKYPCICFPYLKADYR